MVQFDPFADIFSLGALCVAILALVFARRANPRVEFENARSHVAQVDGAAWWDVTFVNRGATAERAKLTFIGELGAVLDSTDGREVRKDGEFAWHVALTPETLAVMASGLWPRGAFVIKLTWHEAPRFAREHSLVVSPKVPWIK